MAWLEPCLSTVAVRPWYVPLKPAHTGSSTTTLGSKLYQSYLCALLGQTTSGGPNDKNNIIVGWNSLDRAGQQWYGGLTEHGERFFTLCIDDLSDSMVEALVFGIG